MWRRIRSLEPFVRQHMLAIIGGSLALLASAALQLVGPWVQKELIDRILPMKLTGTLAVLVLIWGASLVSAQGLRTLGAYIMSGAAQAVATTIRSHLIRHSAEMDFLSFQRTGSQQLLGLITNNATVVARDFGTASVIALMAVFTFVANALLLYVIDFRLMVISIAIVPLAVLLGALFTKPAFRFSRSTQDAVAKLTDVTRDQINGATDIRTSVAHQWSIAQVERASSTVARVWVRRELLMGAAISAMDLINLLPIVAIFFIGGIQVISGSLSIGSLIAFVGYMSRVLEASGQFSAVPGALQPILASIDRINEFLNLPREASLSAHKTIDKVSSVSLQHASVFIDGKTVLSDVSLSLQTRTDVAIVGESGSGKSSIAALVCGLLPISQGEVIVNNEASSSEFQPSSIRRRIGLVSRDSHIFSTTVRDNILLGRDLDHEDVERACAIAQLANVIDKLEGGWDCALQSGGTNLSAGERQRIALARVLAQKPDLLILDEALSSLDRMTLRAFWREFLSWKGRPTVILLTHDLEMASEFGQIYVMAGGKVVQQGSHSDLIDSPGVYQTLWRGGTIPDQSTAEPL